MAAGKVDLVVTYGVIPGTTDAFKIGTSGDPYQGDTPWKDMTAPHKESRRIIHSNDGPFTISRDRNQVQIAFTFMTVQENEGDLKDEIQLIETVFSQKWQDVKLEINGEEQYSFSHNNATGFESTASITKGTGGSSRVIDGSFSRNYRVSITVGLPHDQNYYASGESGLGITGLANSSVGVSFNTDNKKSVAISGAYSALPTSPAYEDPDDSDKSTETGAVYARTQFEAEIEDYCAAVLASIDPEAEFEVSYQSTDVKDSVLTTAGIAKGKMITFNRKYEELFFQEGPGPYANKPDGDAGDFDASKIKEQSLTVTPKVNQGNAMGRNNKGAYGIPLVSASVVYLCTFDRLAFDTDYLTIEDMKEQYDLLRPWLIEKVKESLKDTASTENGGFFVMSENVGYNCDGYKITVSMGVAALSSEGGVGSRFTSRSMVYTLQRQYGKTLVPIWDKSSPYSRYLFQGAASRTLTFTETWKYMGSDVDLALLWSEPKWADFAPDKKWKFVVKSVVKDFTPLKQGIDPDSVKAGDYSQRYTVEYYTDIAVAPAVEGPRTAVKPKPREPGAGLGLNKANQKKFGGD